MANSEIQYLRGNAIDKMLSTSNSTLLHLVNCQGVMGSGVAKEIKDRIPEAYEMYRYAYDSGYLELGSVNYTYDLRVINLAAQYYYGGNKRHLNYGALSDCLCSAASLLSPSATIIVPYNMGCDRAGGSWEVVSEMLEYFFKDHLIISCEI